MPFRSRRVNRKSTRRPKRRVRRRRRRNPGRTTQLSRNPISKSQVVHMRYVEYFTLDPTVANSVAFIFRANGCFDPNVAIGGHQPYGFDQWMGFYNHFTVLGSKITCRFMPGSSASITNDCIVGVQLKASAVVDTTNLATVLEQGSTGWRYLGVNSTSTVVSKGYAPRSFFGVKDITDSVYRGDATGDPVEQAYFHCIAMANDVSSNPGPIEVQATIQYTVLLTEPRPLSGS